MTGAEQREAARQFYHKWYGRGQEDADDRSFWIDILQDIFDVTKVTDYKEMAAVAKRKKSAAGVSSKETSGICR